MTVIELEELVKQLQEEIKILQNDNEVLRNSIANLETKVSDDFLQKLQDVEINETLVPLTVGDLLQYGSDGKWHNVNIKNIEFDIPKPTTRLSDLEDVVLHNVTNDSHLMYNVSLQKWTNTIPKDEEDETDLSNYLTKREAAEKYFPFAGGIITGPTTVKSYFHTTGNITSEAAITAKQSAI